MCSPASMVVTKNRVFWSETSDHHEEIIKEFKLQERNVRGEYNFVRVEIVPPKANSFGAPLSKWVFSTDQDLLPEWYNKKEAEKSVRAELRNWVKFKVIKKGEHTFSEGFRYVIGGSVTLKGRAFAKLYNNAPAELFNNASARLYDNASAVKNGTLYTACKTIVTNKVT